MLFALNVTIWMLAVVLIPHIDATTNEHHPTHAVVDQVCKWDGSKPTQESNKVYGEKLEETFAKFYGFINQSTKKMDDMVTGLSGEADTSEPLATLKSQMHETATTVKSEMHKFKESVRITNLYLKKAMNPDYCERMALKMWIMSMGVESTMRDQASEVFSARANELKLNPLDVPTTMPDIKKDIGSEAFIQWPHHRDATIAKIANDYWTANAEQLGTFAGKIKAAEIGMEKYLGQQHLGYEQHHLTGRSVPRQEYEKQKQMVQTHITNRLSEAHIKESLKSCLALCKPKSVGETNFCIKDCVSSESSMIDNSSEKLEALDTAMKLVIFEASLF